MLTANEVLAAYEVRDVTAGTIPQVKEVRGIVPVGIVPHHTGVKRNPDGSLGNSLAWLQHGAYEAYMRGEIADYSSADQLVRLEGGKAVIYKLTRLSGNASTDEMSYHSGRSIWQGRQDSRQTLNRLTIGVECEHTGSPTEPYPYPMLLAVGATLAYLSALYHMQTTWFPSHRLIALPPGRKSDPSDCFDWAIVYRAFWALQDAWPAGWPTRVKALGEPSQDIEAGS